MAELFQSSRTNVVEHIKHIYEEGELNEEATYRKFRQVQEEGNRLVERKQSDRYLLLFRNTLVNILPELPLTATT